MGHQSVARAAISVRRPFGDGSMSFGWRAAPPTTGGVPSGSWRGSVRRGAGAAALAVARAVGRGVGARDPVAARGPGVARLAVEGAQATVAGRVRRRAAGG